MEKDEKFPNFFFRKVFGGRSELVSVLDENDSEVCGNKNVKMEVWNFYATLFSESRRDLNVEEGVLEQVNSRHWGVRIALY